MHFLQMTVDSIGWVQKISFALSLIICFLFLLQYKRFAAAIEKEEMLDAFLNPLGRHMFADGDAGPSTISQNGGEMEEDNRLTVS